MKILLCNQSWFADDFKRAGHEVMTFGHAGSMDVRQSVVLMHIDTIIKQLPGNFVPDRLVFYDDSAPILVTGLEETSIPTLFYSVDTHHHASWHKYLGQLVDYTLVAQRDYLPEFESIGAPAEWMPLWASGYVEPLQEKKYGAVFVGTLNSRLNPDRVKFFDDLKHRVEILCKSGPFWDIFAASEIVINQTVKGDLNFRVFEAMMSGAALLTERTPNGLLELFEEGRHLVTYERGNVEEAAEKIRELLNDKQRCQRIGAAGRAEILNKHLPEHRAARILTILETLEKRHSPMRCFGAMVGLVRLSCLSEEKKLGYELHALAAALKSAEEGLLRDECINDDIAVQAVLGCLKYDVLSRSNAGNGFILRLSARYPNIEILRVARIRALLNDGLVEEAKDTARRFFIQDPEKTFQVVEMAIQSLLEQSSCSEF